jgi:hypothetical protein
VKEEEGKCSDTKKFLGGEKLQSLGEQIARRKKRSKLIKDLQRTLTLTMKMALVILAHEFANSCA